MTDNDEQRWVAQAQADPRAFAQLYDRYVDRIYAFVFRLAGDPALAADVTAATFEKALQHIRRFQWQGASFGAWLYRIARNELAGQQRKQRWLAPLRAWLPGRVSVEAQVTANETEAAIQAALRRLAPGDRELLVLRFYEDLSSAEVAAIVGIKPNTLYVRLHRALGRLRQELDEPELEVSNYVPRKV